MSFSSCLRLLPHLPISYVFPSITSRRRQALGRRIYITLPFLVYVGYSFPSWLYVILFHLSHDQFYRSSPSFSSTKFQYFPGISVLLSEVSSNFQQHTKLCSKCSTLVSFSLKSQFAFEKSLFLVERWFCYGNIGFNFTCASCIICYHATQIGDTLHSALYCTVVFYLSQRVLKMVVLRFSLL